MFKDAVPTLMLHGTGPVTRHHIWVCRLGNVELAITIGETSLDFADLSGRDNGTKQGTTYVSIVENKAHIHDAQHLYT